MIDYLVEMWQELLVVFGTSMIPVGELRVAIPLAHFTYDFPWYVSFIICVLGNLVPVPFLVMYMKPIFRFIKRIGFFARIVEWLEKRTMKKVEKVEKYSGPALCLFVAIPLPGTGAWTGAMIAAMMDMRLKKSIPWITLGVVIAGTVVTLLTYIFGIII